ncbi:hypothetical protein DFH06DRAFT_1225705, partial [Mycena polygramma]
MSLLFRSVALGFACLLVERRCTPLFSADDQAPNKFSKYMCGSRPARPSQRNAAAQSRHALQCVSNGRIFFPPCNCRVKRASTHQATLIIQNITTIASAFPKLTTLRRAAEHRYEQYSTLDRWWKIAMFASQDFSNVAIPTPRHLCGRPDHNHRQRPRVLFSLTHSYSQYSFL